VNVPIVFPWRQSLAASAINVLTTLMSQTPTEANLRRSPVKAIHVVIAIVIMVVVVVGLVA